MTDTFVLPDNVRQFLDHPGRCASFDCGAAATATGINGALGTHYGAGYIRQLSKQPCVVTSTSSGGLSSAGIETACKDRGVPVDFARVGGLPKRRNLQELKDRCKNSEEYCIILGDYDGVPKSMRESKTFLGDHWAGVSDYRASDDTFAWYDPLADERRPKRMKAASVEDYWINTRVNSKAIKGCGGFIRWKPEVEQVVRIIQRQVEGTWSAEAGADILTIDYDITKDVEKSRKINTAMVPVSGRLDSDITVSRDGPGRPNGRFVHAVDGPAPFKGFWLDDNEITITITSGVPDPDLLKSTHNAGYKAGLKAVDDARATVPPEEV